MTMETYTTTPSQVFDIEGSSRQIISDYLSLSIDNLSNLKTKSQSHLDSILASDFDRPNSIIKSHASTQQSQQKVSIKDLDLPFELLNNYDTPTPSLSKLETTTMTDDEFSSQIPPKIPELTKELKEPTSVLDLPFDYIDDHFEEEEEFYEIEVPIIDDGIFSSEIKSIINSTKTLYRYTSIDDAPMIQSDDINKISHQISSKINLDTNSGFDLFSSDQSKDNINSISNEKHLIEDEDESQIEISNDIVELILDKLGINNTIFNNVNECLYKSSTESINTITQIEVLDNRLENEDIDIVNRISNEIASEFNVNEKIKNDLFYYGFNEEDK
ncbi:hypothetical protein TRFO_26847 [Tritrichomonas foetus]|uniref:Uncharacterized protein n=1 Tax=Tritrichomonas foetus TaxID=1144522 RepID=A0A1J4K6S4_9EUKA|nr:hypothetical protein TRFO_26847 [Tritrichomonas foetus]|eukprot:OHT05428.1 hypothetical protein TRFO_26847 [Tritrichomonas foetus]